MRKQSHKSARHSINGTASDFTGSEEDDDDGALSNSDWIATMTAEMSYIELGHSLIIRSKACNGIYKYHEMQCILMYADQFIMA